MFRALGAIGYWYWLPQRTRRIWHRRWCVSNRAQIYPVRSAVGMNGYIRRSRRGTVREAWAPIPLEASIPLGAAFSTVSNGQDAPFSSVFHIPRGLPDKFSGFPYWW